MFMHGRYRSSFNERIVDMLEDDLTVVNSIFVKMSGSISVKCTYFGIMLMSSSSLLMAPYASGCWCSCRRRFSPKWG